MSSPRRCLVQNIFCRTLRVKIYIYFGPTVSINVYYQNGKSLNVSMWTYACFPFLSRVFYITKRSINIIFLVSMRTQQHILWSGSAWLVIRSCQLLCYLLMTTDNNNRLNDQLCTFCLVA